MSTRATGWTPPRLAALCAALLLGGGGCSPYPDDGEFLAGVVFNGNFLSGVKSLAAAPAAVNVRGAAAYGLYITGGNSGSAVSTASPASSPLWADAGKRDPLNPATAQTVYVFDGARSCSAPEDASPYDPRFDLIDVATSYPIFVDLPEVLSTNGGRAGRTGAYSAIVEVVHLSAPAGTACQAYKRSDTVKKLLDDGTLKVQAGAAKEYRLLQIIDTAVTAPPLPYQLGWFNQLVVPYLDMGPVPLVDGKFKTMPLYSLVLTDAMGGNPTTTSRVAAVLADDAPQMGAPLYSPICQDYALRYTDPKAAPPADARDPAYAKATAGTTLSSCLVCRLTADGKGVVCPFEKSGGGAR